MDGTLAHWRIGALARCVAAARRCHPAAACPSQPWRPQCVQYLACKPLHAHLANTHDCLHTLAHPCTCSLPGCPNWSWAAPPAANPPAGARRKLPGVAQQHSTAPTAAAQRSRSWCTPPRSGRPACECAAGVWGWASADVAAASVECAVGSDSGPWRQPTREDQLSCGCNKPVRAGLLVACRYRT